MFSSWKPTAFLPLSFPFRKKIPQLLSSNNFVGGHRRKPIEPVPPQICCRSRNSRSYKQFDIIVIFESFKSVKGKREPLLLRLKIREPSSHQAFQPVHIIYHPHVRPSAASGNIVMLIREHGRGGDTKRLWRTISKRGVWCAAHRNRIWAAVISELLETFFRKGIDFCRATALASRGLSAVACWTR